MSSSDRVARGRPNPPRQCVCASIWLCTGVLPRLNLNSIPHALSRLSDYTARLGHTRTLEFPLSCSAELLNNAILFRAAFIADDLTYFQEVRSG